MFGQICFGDQFCTIEEFQKCLKLLQSVGSEESDLALPVTEEELYAACIDLNDGVICLDQHIEKCFSPEMQQVYINVATDAKQFVADLCHNITVQKEFLRHAKCFRNVSLDEHKCADRYREAVAISVDLEGKDLDVELLDKESIMRRSCCALQEFVLCKNRHVVQDCGQRASLFMEKHLHRITNPIMDQHCSAYTYGPDACTQKDSQTNNAINNHNFSNNCLLITFLLSLVLFSTFSFREAFIYK
ncbi:uncharacterized protein LOC128951249 [Oppia nitens]|uniref:uncharacterized protein LOC128951249 n=1 Tax=Oppia nitens TaxID=1686743 RepID=UPI0023DC9D77|nr:uncharacterized protein LOC128951249 [Oppia nitens]